MQFNYLGGQSNRDTLAQALNQRSPNLDAALEFNKAAFVTGVSGAGQTLRTAMGLDAQQQEAKMNRKTQMQMQTQRLSEEATQFDRQFDLQGQRIEENRLTAEESQRAAEERARLAQSGKESRERTEYDRRYGEAKADKDAALKLQTENLTKTQEGAIVGMKSKFDAMLPMVPEDIRGTVKTQWEAVYGKLETEKDPNKRAGMIATLGDLLDPKSITSMVQGAKKSEKKPETQATDTDAPRVYSPHRGAWGAPYQEPAPVSVIPKFAPLPR